jgi:hypothetical protein
MDPTANQASDIIQRGISLKVARLHFERIDVQITDLSRARYYAEPIPQSPRFPVIQHPMLGII